MFSGFVPGSTPVAQMRASSRVIATATSPFMDSLMANLPLVSNLPNIESQIEGKVRAIWRYFGVGPMPS
jgi:hypothetical protein